MTAPGTHITTSQRRTHSTQPQIWGPVPLRNPDFVGRTELLERLRERLTESGTTAILPEALHGMGGVGKSQTMIEYIHRHAAEYEMVWRIPAEQPAQIKASFVELAKRLSVTTAGTEVQRPSPKWHMGNTRAAQRFTANESTSKAPAILAPPQASHSGCAERGHHQIPTPSRAAAHSWQAEFLIPRKLLNMPVDKRMRITMPHNQEPWFDGESPSDFVG